MLLPPGTLQALKGQTEAIVTVVCLAMSLAAMAAGIPAWAVICLLAIALAAYHIRATRKENHDLAMASSRVEQEAVTVEVVKARFRELHRTDQPSLPLQVPNRPLEPGRPRGNKP